MQIIFHTPTCVEVGHQGVLGSQRHCQPSEQIHVAQVLALAWRCVGSDWKRLGKEMVGKRLWVGSWWFESTCKHEMQSARGHCFPSFNPKAFPDVLSLQLPPKSYGAASYREDKSFWYAHMFSRGSKVSGTQLPNNYWSASAHSLSFFVKTLNRALGSKKSDIKSFKVETTVGGWHRWYRHQNLMQVGCLPCASTDASAEALRNRMGMLKTHQESPRIHRALIRNN